MNHPDAPNTDRRHSPAIVPRAAQPREHARLHAARRSLVVVVAALVASVLTPAVGSAHEPVSEPYTETRREPVYSYEPQDPVWGVTGTETVPLEESEKVYETRRVQVAPFTKTVDVFYYTYRDERVKPFTKTVPVFYYTYRDERVKPFTKTVVVLVYNYKTVKGACHPMYGCEYTRVRVGPYTMIKTVPAYNYEVRKTRAAPFTKTVAVHNYKVRKTRVRPFTKTVPVAESEKVYETRKVQVAPFTKTVDVHGWIPQPKLKVFQGYNTVTYTHPTDTVTKHDASEHTCPPGQHMKPLPKLRVARHGHYYTPEQLYDYRISGEYTFTERIQVHVRGSDRLSTAIKTVPVEWGEMNAHTGCHQSKYPTPPERKEGPSVLKTFWDVVTGPVKDTLESATISATKPMQKAQPTVYAIAYHGLCTLGNALDNLATWLVGVPAFAKYRDQIVTLAKRIAAKIKHAKVLAGVAGVAAVAIELLLCNFGVKPGDNDLPDLTETTPTTTTTPPKPKVDPPKVDPPKVDPPKPTVNPLGLPVVSELPSFDHTKHTLKFSESRVPVVAGCTPWVFWARFSRSVWKCPR